MSDNPFFVCPYCHAGLAGEADSCPHCHKRLPVKTTLYVPTTANGDIPERGKPPMRSASGFHAPAQFTLLLLGIGLFVLLSGLLGLAMGGGFWLGRTP